MEYHAIDVGDKSNVAKLCGNQWAIDLVMYTYNKQYVME